MEFAAFFIVGCPDHSSYSHGTATGGWVSGSKLGWISQPLDGGS